MDQVNRSPSGGQGSSDMTSLFGRHGYPSLAGSRDYPAIMGACCQAWNRFLAEPEVVRSVTTRAWARVNG